MTSTHEGVSCDICRKNNFQGLRYKCLICYDYDLCSICYDANLTSSRHSVNHPMQCIIAKNDYELFYAGENISSDQPQSLTCPLCGSLGFTDSTLLEHVTNEHANSDNDESSTGIICPICGSETNQLTFDFATHLTMEHRVPRDPIEQVAVRGRGGRCHARTAGPRGRRSQSHFNGVGGPNGSSPSAREPNDPLVEILAQLSGVRQRPGGGNNQSPASQLHQLQMQLHSSSSFSPRANEVRIMRRTFQSMSNQLNSSSTSTTTAHPNQEYYCSSQPFVLMDQSSLGPGAAGSMLSGPQQPSALSSPSMPSQYLLAKLMKPALSDTEQQQKEVLKADRSLFVKELLLNP